MKSFAWPFFALLLITYAIVSCKKDPSQAQPDWLKPFKASFTINEPIYGSQRVFPTDTIISNSVTFTADGYTDSCKWTIGTDPRVRTGRSVSLYFTTADAGQSISVTLIAYWYGKADTVRKNFTVMGLKKFDDRATPYTVEPPYVGKFLGSFEDNSSHKFLVTIANFGPYPAQLNGAYYWDFRIFNLPEGCGAPMNSPTCQIDTISPYRYAYTFETTYKAFYVNTNDINSCCPPAVMYGYMDSVDHNKIIIEYRQTTNNNGRIDTVAKKTFIGYRQ